MIPEFCPRIDRIHLMASTVLAGCTYYYDLTRHVSFTVLLHQDNVVVDTENKLYSLPGLHSGSNLYDVFHLLRVDYYGMDITTNILMNHVHSMVLGRRFDAQEYLPISINLYSYEVAVYALMYGGITTQADIEMVRDPVSPNHIAVDVAMSVIR